MIVKRARQNRFGIYAKGDRSIQSPPLTFVLSLFLSSPLSININTPNLLTRRHNLPQKRVDLRFPTIPTRDPTYILDVGDDILLYRT